MSPWTVIGWIIVAVIAAPCLFFVCWVFMALIKYVSRSIRHYTGYFKTRNKPPELGQIWKPRKGVSIRIERIYSDVDGNKKIASSGQAFSKNLDEWNKYVKSRRMRLL